MVDYLHVGLTFFILQGQPFFVFSFSESSPCSLICCDLSSQCMIPTEASRGASVAHRLHRVNAWGPQHGMCCCTLLRSGILSGCMPTSILKKLMKKCCFQSASVFPAAPTHGHELPWHLILVEADRGQSVRLVNEVPSELNTSEYHIHPYTMV